MVLETIPAPTLSTVWIIYNIFYLPDDGKRKKPSSSRHISTHLWSGGFEKIRAAVSFCEKQKPDDPHAISRGGILGGCRHVCVSGSQYPWVTSVKKSLAPPPGHYVFISVLSSLVNQHNHSFSCRASIPLWGAGVFACRFLDRQAVCYRCRSPPPFDSLVNRPWIEMEVHNEES